MRFIALRNSDLPVVKEIYDWYVRNSTATFHTEPIRIDQLLEFICIDHKLYRSFLILDQDDFAVGYCLLTSHKRRPAYDRTAEVTIYLRHNHLGKGIGKVALRHLESIAKEVGLKNLVGVITGDNDGSIALFERCGYTKCAHFRNIGEKFGKVLDVVAYQKEI